MFTDSHNGIANARAGGWSTGHSPLESIHEVLDQPTKEIPQPACFTMPMNVIISGESGASSCLENFVAWLTRHIFSCTRFAALEDPVPSNWRGLPTNGDVHEAIEEQQTHCQISCVKNMATKLCYTRRSGQHCVAFNLTNLRAPEFCRFATHSVNDLRAPKFHRFLFQ